MSVQFEAQLSVASETLAQRQQREDQATPGGGEMQPRSEASVICGSYKTARQWTWTATVRGGVTSCRSADNSRWSARS
jgi:hypothetical protein